jgi:hypothetical protein
MSCSVHSLLTNIIKHDSQSQEIQHQDEPDEVITNVPDVLSTSVPNVLDKVAMDVVGAVHYAFTLQCALIVN